MTTPGRRADFQVTALLAIALLTQIAANWMGDALWWRLEALQYDTSFELLLSLLAYAFVAAVAAYLGPLASVAISIGLMIVAAATQDRAAPGLALLLVSVATTSTYAAVTAAIVRVGGTLLRTAVLLVALHAVHNIPFLLAAVRFSPSPEQVLFPVLTICAVAMALFVTVGASGEDAGAADAPAGFHWPVLVALPLVAGAAGLQSALWDAGLGLQSQQLGSLAAGNLHSINSLIVVIAAMPLIAFLRRARWRNGYVPLGLLAAGGLALSAASVVPLFELAGRATTTPFVLFITLGELLTLPLLLARFAAGHSWRTVTAMVVSFLTAEEVFRWLPALAEGRVSDAIRIGVLAGLLIAAAVALVAIELYATRWLWPKDVAPTADDALLDAVPAAIREPPPAART